MLICMIELTHNLKPHSIVNSEVQDSAVNICFSPIFVRWKRSIPAFPAELICLHPGSTQHWGVRVQMSTNVLSVTIMVQLVLCNLVHRLHFILQSPKRFWWRESFGKSGELGQREGREDRQVKMRSRERESGGMMFPTVSQKTAFTLIDFTGMNLFLFIVSWSRATVYEITHNLCGFKNY